MKKRFLGVLLALCLCLTLLPTAALADTTPDWTGWTELTAETTSISGGKKNSPKKYYLNGNVSISSTLQISGTVTLDLNGNVLQMTGEGSVINVASGSNLTLQDSGSSTPHYFDSEWTWDSEATSQPTDGHTVNGGIITGGNAVDRNANWGGGVHADGAITFNMTGGSIVGCTSNYGGGVYLHSGGCNFNMTGGSIVGCTATDSGGGVIANSGTSFTMSNSRIIACSAGAWYGGGVYVNGGSFTMNSGSIERCTASRGGGVFVSNSFTMNGGSIDDCTAPGLGGGVFIYNGRTMYANGGTINGDVGNNGTITRSGDATGYTTFNGEINGYGGSINEAACPHAVTFTAGEYSKTVKVLDGQPVSAPGDASKSGYSLTWKNGDAEYDFSTKVKSSFSLTGTYSLIDYNIDYKLDGGALPEGASNPTSYTIISNPITLENPTKTGYTFTGWSGTGIEDKSESVTIPTGSTGERTYIANWEANTDTAYQVEYYEMDTSGQYPTAATSTIPLTGTTDTTAVVTPDIPSGFTLDKKKSTLADNIAGDGTLVLSVYLQREQCTVTFDTDGGSAVDAQTVYYGAAVTAPDAPTRAGYFFLGWFSDETKYDFSSPVTGDLTLTAKWLHLTSDSTYAVTVSDTKNGSVSVSPGNAGKGATVTISVTPDAGYTLETLTVLDRNGNEIELTNMGGGKYSFKMPAGKVTVEAAFMEDNTMLNFFVDVSADKYYYDAVLWAAENGITGGVDETHFGPDQHCTRAQLAAFLYRYAQLQGKGFTGAWMFRLPFTDVSEWCYEAVAWCSMNGIVTGYGDGLFGTDDDITREQVVTMLYRFAIAAGMDVSVGEDTNILSYRDALDISDYALEAFQWACGAGIVEGADGALLPGANCTRAQIVTMLYRLLGK